jgi:transposase
MDRLTDPPAGGIVVGVDAHTDTHDAAMLDDRGRLLATRTFAADGDGYRQLVDWMNAGGRLLAIGVESTGSYAAGLVRFLREGGVDVLEVNQPHPHTRRRRGKNDPIDAEMAARHVLAANRLVIAKDTSGIVEAIRQLRVARDGAVKARSAALNAIDGLTVTAPESLRQQLKARKTTRGRATLCAGLRPQATRLQRARASCQGRTSLARASRCRSRRRDQAPRRSAQAARRSGRPGHHQPHRGVHRTRRHAAGLRWPEHRAPAP